MLTIAAMMSAANISGNHVIPTTAATMMPPANISYNRITPTTAATNNISTMMLTPQSGNNSISARVNEDFAKMFSSTLSDSSVDLSLSAMLNDSSFVSEIFVNEMADSQPLSCTRELLSSSEITFISSLKTETPLQHC